jgi:hypothetical protein
MRRPTALAAVALLAAAAAACGDDGPDRLALRTPPERTSAEPLPRAARAGEQERRAAKARPTRVDARRSRSVLRGWGDALRRDSNRRAARYFAVPAIVAQGDVLSLDTAGEVREFNERFPCGARLLHVQPDGRFLVGTFVLTRRPAHECPARGDLLRVAFALRRRKIAEWREVPQAALPGRARPEKTPEPAVQGSA